MDVVGDGTGAGGGTGREGSEGAHFCSHGAPVLVEGGEVRLPPVDEGEEAAAADEEEEETWREAGEEERRRSGRRRWMLGRDERRKEWWSGSSESAMERGERRAGRRLGGFSAVAPWIGESACGVLGLVVADKGGGPERIFFPFFFLVCPSVCNVH